MKLIDSFTLLTLAALWGSSYLFLRLGAAEFGPAPLAAVRAAGAAVLLAPLLWRGGRLKELRQHWKAILAVGLLHSALPYFLFSYATLSITAGLAAILTAATPHFAAVVSRCWVGEKWPISRSMGLVLGFGGVSALVVRGAGVQPGADSAALAIGACLTAAFLYAFSATLSKRALGHVSPTTVAAGTQAGAALGLIGPGIAAWPELSPGPGAWAAAAALAVACTAVAYLLFFRLVRRIGATRTVTVTFLIPVFGLLWGWLFLDEAVTPSMFLGIALILAGTVLATGQNPLSKSRPGAAPAGAELRTSEVGARGSAGTPRPSVSGVVTCYREPHKDLYVRTSRDDRMGPGRR